MEQIEIFEIPNPCKGICEVNIRGYCKGCYRSREERFAWGQLTEQQKKHVITLCQQRYKRYLAKQTANTSPKSGADDQQQLDF
ncbi:DUF1289 domain-containing protein [Pseudoalteromonas sp. MMG013]|uniref:DUF1289 domain-containing protein n=1 Tax=Pseudoalteromonas sp. MMG013 TaxID=2822687 RepID=UPI001B389B78|nr:DUF1289 domain-containing protein [Pseudoalteromonas sp. MMG013]